MMRRTKASSHALLATQQRAASAHAQLTRSCTTVQEGLIKVLFATETFAMGLNMPARSVLFTTYFKNDGVRTRALTSGEYVQMSGRAGRRGKDKRGYVMLLVEDPDKFSPTVAKQLISGRPMPLMSRFKLSYYTLLNLSKRREGGMDHMEYLIAHSFQQHQLEQQGPRLQARIAEIDRELAASGAGGAPQPAFWGLLRCMKGAILAKASPDLPVWLQVVDNVHVHRAVCT